MREWVSLFILLVSYLTTRELWLSSRPKDSGPDHYTTCQVVLRFCSSSTALVTSDFISPSTRQLLRGVADALATIEANRSRNGYDNHDSGTGIRRQTHVARQGNGRCELHTTLPGIGTDVRKNVSRGVRSVEKYVGGLPDMIQGSMMASKPKIMQDAIEFTTELMDQKIHTFAEDKLRTKGNLTTTTKLNDNLPRGKM
ncbi:hypothetical protein Tco_0276433 [Tanacetum coccineum]